MQHELYIGDLPASFFSRNITSVAIDTETTGLKIYNSRDRLCLIQIATRDGEFFLIQIPKGYKEKPTVLIKLLEDPSIEKIYHFARFDMATLYMYTNIMSKNNYCTKTASVVVRTNSDRHGLKVLCYELLRVSIQKSEQCSNWGAHILTESQIEYAKTDVKHLHSIKDELDKLTKQESKEELVKAALQMLSYRVLLDINGYEDVDILSPNPYPRT